MQKYRCLVTGGAGFIGSHISDRLLSVGHEVLCLDNLNDYYDPALKEKNIALLSRHDNFEMIRGDITDRDVLGKAMNDIDYVFHNAALAGVGFSIKNPFKSNEVNVNGTMNILDAAARNRVRKVIFASSSSVYGNAKDLPLAEEHRAMPISPYGVTKLCSENYCEIFSSIYGLDTVSLRYFTVFGPRMRPDLAISIFTHKALRNENIEIFGDGKKTRDFTYIDNIVDANLLAMGRGHGVYNIGGGESTTIERLAERIIELTGSKSKITHREEKVGDMSHTLADIKKAEREIGFTPRIGLGEGLIKYIEYVRGTTE